MIISLVFWTSLLFILYAYFGYPLLLLVVGAVRHRDIRRGDITPVVSFIITAFNEEKRIREKLENTLILVYPKERLEIIVASDCSSDRTDETVQSFEQQGVRLVRLPERGGKEKAQQVAVEASTGEILVFSDVATILDADAVSNIVKNFNDPTIGCVSSIDRFINPDGSISGEGAYVRYEMFLRSLETRVNTLVGLSGSFFAARRDVCRDWAGDLQSDFNTLLNSVRKGLRGVADPRSIGYYRNVSDDAMEYDRKVRTVLRGISVFMRSLPLLNPFKYGLFSWQLLSHKLCRWLVPFAMISLFISNVLLLGHATFYWMIFLLQAAFYLLSLSGMKKKAANKILKIPSFFLLVNLSILNAWIRYLRGERMVSWTPSQR